MNWLESVIGFVAGSGGSAVLMHHLNKKKTAAETDSEIIKSAKEIISEWKQLRETYKEEIASHKAEINSLREKMKQNQKECDETNQRLILKIAELEAEIREDKELLHELEQRIKQYEKAA